MNSVEPQPFRDFDMIYLNDAVAGEEQSIHIISKTMSNKEYRKMMKEYEVVSEDCAKTMRKKQEQSSLYWLLGW